MNTSVQAQLEASRFVIYGLPGCAKCEEWKEFFGMEEEPFEFKRLDQLADDIPAREAWRSGYIFREERVNRITMKKGMARRLCNNGDAFVAPVVFLITRPSREAESWKLIAEAESPPMLARKG